MTPYQDGPGSPEIRHNAESTRRRLLRAGLELFTSRGYRGTTTPALARRAGLAEGTLYRHFRGKQELYNEAFRATQGWASDLVAELDRAPPGAGSPGTRARLERLARRLVESATRDPAAVRMLLARPPEGLLDDASHEAAAAFGSAVEEIVAQGKADGTVRAGPADLWASVWLEVIGLALHRIARRDWLPDQAPVGQVIEAGWSAIAASAPPPDRACGGGGGG